MGLTSQKQWYFPLKAVVIQEQVSLTISIKLKPLYEQSLEIR